MSSSNKLKTGVRMGWEDRLCERTVCDRAVCERVVCESAVCDKERLRVTILYVKESCVKGSM